jgi:hypothetical protein
MDMAFNPFHRFRKHQKVFFAILTIICMITFVFQFGAGDPFTRIMGWFGYVGSKGKGEVVTTLYGDKVHEGGIDYLRLQRRLAQDFMSNTGIPLALDLAVGKLSEQQQKATPTSPGPLPPGGVALVPQAVAARMSDVMRGTLRISREQHHDAALADLHTIRAAVEKPPVQTSPDQLMAQLKALDALANAVAFQAWFFNPQRGDEYFFGGGPKDAELLDFLIWKHHADKLGITLTEADVIREINRAAGSSLLPKPWMPEEPFERNVLVRQFLNPNRERRQGPMATTSDLLEALKEEFRVQMAQEAILGHGSGVRYYLNQAEPVRVTPTAATPDEFLTYFREHRTTLKVALLPINVADYTKEVAEQPAEKTLEHLYDLYKNKVPTPAERAPGFKEPRRLRLQYASVNPESPFCVAEAKKMAGALAIYSDPAASAALRVAAGVNPYPAGGWPAWAAAAALPKPFDPLLQEYDRYLQEEKELAAGKTNFLDSKAVPAGTSGFDLRDRSLVKDKPTVYASLVGQFLGAGLTGTATPVAAASILPGVEALYQRTTLRAIATEVLTGASGSPLPALGLAVGVTHAPLSRQEVQPLLLARFEKDLAQKLVSENLNTFQEQLNKLKGKPAEAEKYVEEAVKKFGFQDFKTMPRLASSFEMADDPSLKPLKDAWDTIRKEPILRRFTSEQLPPLVDFLFNTNAGIYQPIVFPQPELVRLFGLPEKTFWAFWRIEDKPARVRPFDEIRDEVAASWRFDKARLKALKEAQRIDEELKKQHLSAADAVRFLRDQKHGAEFELDNVAMLVPPRKDEIFVGRQSSAEFQPYEVPRDKIAYPPANFVQQLLTLKAPGDSRVIADKPSKHYYVAVLLERSVPRLREFYEVYAKAAPEDPIWQRMMEQRRRDLDQDLLRQLRLEAAGKDNVDEDGNLKLKVRNRETSTEGAE